MKNNLLKAQKISQYLLTGMHHSTAEGQAAIAEIINQPPTDTPVYDRDKRDGNWLDDWGCCRVCDGEIPYGHTEDCDIFKMEKDIRNHKFLVTEARKDSERLAASLRSVCLEAAKIPQVTTTNMKVWTEATNALTQYEKDIKKHG